MQDEKLHWFCFSYTGRSLDSGNTSSASAYTGYKEKEVTLKMIRENKGYAGVDSGAVLISVSYLGRMTKAEFEGDNDETR